MQHVVTCHTEGCENSGIPITLIYPAGRIQCGPCGRVITDIEPPLPDEPYVFVEVEPSEDDDPIE